MVFEIAIVRFEKVEIGDLLALADVTIMNYGISICGVKLQNVPDRDAPCVFMPAKSEQLPEGYRCTKPYVVLIDKEIENAIEDALYAKYFDDGWEPDRNPMTWTEFKESRSSQEAVA